MSDNSQYAHLKNTRAAPNKNTPNSNPVINQVKSLDFKKYIGMFFQYSFYAVLVVLFSFIFLIILQALGFKAFSLLPDDGGLIEIPLLPTNRQVIFSDKLMASDASGNFSNLPPTNYTISMDVYINSDFVNQSAPRVILYRSPFPVVLDSADSTIERVVAKMPHTNFILYLDPYTNDLMADVFVISNRLTGSPSGGSPSGGSPSGGSPSGGSPSGGSPSGAGPSEQAAYTKVSMPPITNVPIRTPFRITMMLSDIVLEIYINGELQKSVPFKFGNSPRGLHNLSYFYGPPAMVGQSVLVSNLSFWNTPLSSKSIRVYGKEALNAAVFKT